jgi:hypothetical protein
MSKVRCLLYGSFSKKGARSQSDTVLQSLAHVVEAVVYYMAALAKKTLARNLTLSLQSLAHVEGVCYMAASAKKTLAIWRRRHSRLLAVIPNSMLLLQ